MSVATEGHRSRANYRCPKCGSYLLIGEGLIWCSYVGSSVSRGSCPFGVNEHVTVEEFRSKYNA